MTDSPHGPGVEWLATRAGRSPEELVKGPASLPSALSEAVAALGDLAARMESDDAEVREAAQAEAAALRERIETAPSAQQALQVKVRDALRDAAARLRDGSAT